MILLFLSNILVLCGIALFAAIVLNTVSKKFAVRGSKKTEYIYELLPHVNCGACGKAGCQAFAEACAKASAKDFAELKCPVGGKTTMCKIAEYLGFSQQKMQKTVAVLRCNGTCQNAPDKIVYSGMPSCRIASEITAGRSGCPDGCLRFGDCVTACRFGALSMDPQTGMPVIDYNKCTSCGACVKMCPRGLFEIRAVDANDGIVYVSCRNKQKAAMARKNCKVACIACGKCAKLNPAIKVENNLSYIPDSVQAELQGDELAAVCPVKAIICQKQILTENTDEA